MARRNSYTGKYTLSKAEYLSAKYYALRYNEWQREYNTHKDSVSAINYDGMPKGENVSDPTEKLAERRAELRKKMEIIEESALEADKEFSSYILRRACDGLSYERMNFSEGLFISKRSFYRRMRKFYYILSKRI